jgi:5-methylcytosine-specific restriction endonuclease McrA
MIIRQLGTKRKVKQLNPNKDPFYQSNTWKSTRSGFIKSTPCISLPPINGIQYSNRFCAFCWQEGVINDERIEVDHIREISDGGSRTDYRNLRSLCHNHHNGKTHLERKKRENAKTR